MRKAVFIGLLFAFAVFLAAAAFSISTISAHREVDARHSQSFDVIRELDAIVTDVLDAENAWHNYERNPENPRYRESFNAAVKDIHKRRDELRSIYSGEDWNARFEELYVLINSRVDVLSEMMNAVTKGFREESQVAALRREELINNELFLAIQDLEKVETAKIIGLGEQMEKLSSKSLYGLFTGALLSVITFSGLVYSLFNELKERERLEQEIKRQAHSDQLTGLPNRLSLMERLAYEMTQAHRSRQRLAVMFIDLDHFKEINDSLGHEAGDTLLKEVAARMNVNVRESDTVARIGGDEFNILLTNIVHTDNISLIAAKIIDSFSRPFTISGQEIFSSASIGISIYPEDGEQSADLLKNADIALYHAKEQGRNNFKFYNPSLNRRTQEKMMLENKLRQTLLKNELVLHYQPLIDIREKRIVCAEALVRWQHPERGLLRPLDFISAAESTGFISALDEWVLRTGCEQAGMWRKVIPGAPCLTVNISSREFKKPDFIPVLRRILAETGFAPGSLELEISEQTAMEDIEDAAVKAHELRGIGVKLAIDNFGAGYFSLNNLRMISLDRIKIDRSFIKELGSSHNCRAIIKAVIAMAHTMDITVVAEGVERQEQLRFLEVNDCDEVQGHLLGRPVPAEEFTRFTASYAA